MSACDKASERQSLFKSANVHEHAVACLFADAFTAACSNVMIIATGTRPALDPLGPFNVDYQVTILDNTFLQVSCQAVQRGTGYNALGIVPVMRVL